MSFSKQIHSNSRKTILFVIPSLEGGGAEKVLIEIITRLSPETYRLVLVMFKAKGRFLSKIPSNVNVYDLHKKNKYSFSKIIFRLCIILKKINPNIVISFMPYANLIAMISRILAPSGAKYILTFHNCLTRESEKEPFHQLKYFLYKKLFIRSNLIICVSKGVKNDLMSKLRIQSDQKMRVIYNPIDIDRIGFLKDNKLEDYASTKFILAVGRLEIQKGYEYLLKAYGLIHSKIEEILIILGIGDEEQNLRELARQLGIQEKVVFLGFQENPYKYMKNASALVLSSLWEGFGNVIVEAMACGTPVISTDCPSGPNEIIDNGVNGILVPIADENSLANAIIDLLRNQKLRVAIIDAARKRAEDFRAENIIKRYEELII
jgi:glycosyltransferase involved in cell wall biosynthesis